MDVFEFDFVVKWSEAGTLSQQHWFDSRPGKTAKNLKPTSGSLMIANRKAYLKNCYIF